MIGLAYVSECADDMKSAGLQVEQSGADIEFSKISIDSRSIKSGELFVAIKGERLDGHNFIQQALDNGAGVIVAERYHPAMKEKSYLLVNDSFKALGLLGKFNRSRFKQKVVGLTGSSGKTSTKEMLAVLLSGEMNTLSTLGNLNNYYGVPLMLSRITEEHEAAVIEMGTNAPGEIAYLSEMTSPDVGLITNASAAHLLGLGSVAGVVSEKGDLIKGIVNGGTIVLNGNDPAFNTWCERVKAERPDLKIASFGIDNSELDVFASDIESLEAGMSFTLHSGQDELKVIIPVWGRHQVANACAALVVVQALGFAIEAVVKSFSAIKAAPGRGQRTVLDSGALVIDESYNANVNSTKSAIDMLSLCNSRYKILVLADMKELGDYEEEAHHEIGHYLNTKKIDELITYGDLAQYIQASWQGKGQHYTDKAALCTGLQHKLNDNVAVLIKGSFSMGMADVVNACLNYHSDGSCK